MAVFTVFWWQTQTGGSVCVCERESLAAHIAHSFVIWMCHQQLFLKELSSHFLSPLCFFPRYKPFTICAHFTATLQFLSVKLRETFLHSTSVLLTDVQWDASWKMVKIVVRTRGISEFRSKNQKCSLLMCAHITFHEEQTWQYPASCYFKVARPSLYEWNCSSILQCLMLDSPAGNCLWIISASDCIISSLPKANTGLLRRHKEDIFISLSLFFLYFSLIHWISSVLSHVGGLGERREFSERSASLVCTCCAFVLRWNVFLVSVFFVKLNYLLSYSVPVSLCACK